MGRFIVNVVAMVIVLLIGAAWLDIHPSTPEFFLIVFAWIFGDVVETVIFGER